MKILKYLSPFDFQIEQIYIVVVVAQSMSNKKRRLFPVPVDIVNKLIETCSGECQCTSDKDPGYSPLKCFGCKKLVCSKCEMYWMKCPNTGYHYGEEICSHLSGNKYCYGCVRAWRKDGTVCRMCHRKPIFFLV